MFRLIVKNPQTRINYNTVILVLPAGMVKRKNVLSHAAFLKGEIE